MRSYPNLALLMAGYFHQDWHMDSPTAAAVVCNFLREPSDVVRGLRAELDDLLSGALDEQDLREVLKRAGGYFDPESIGMSTAEWLAAVRQQVPSVRS